MTKRIYLDNNSTTPLDPRVLEAMLFELKGPPANPSSIHSFGREAKKLLEESRRDVAAFFQAKPEGVIFTSGGTEAMNLLLRTLPKGHLITTQIEHSSLHQTALSLQNQGYSVTFLEANSWGAPTVEQIEKAIQPDTRAIALFAANGETGVKIDIPKVASLADRHQIPLFLDAVAYIGKEPFIPCKGISAITLSAHKFHGPKGVGAIISYAPLKFHSLLAGGGQEMGRRAGTENLAAIIGLSEALRILKKDEAQITAHILSLRSHFERELLRTFPNLIIHGLGPRISNTSNIAFANSDGETLLLQLDLLGIAASHGSACSSGALEPSRILTNMGINRKTARSSIRFSFSRMNTQQEVDLALEHLHSLLKRL